MATAEDIIAQFEAPPPTSVEAVRSQLEQRKAPPPTTSADDIIASFESQPLGGRAITPQTTPEGITLPSMQQSAADLPDATKQDQTIARDMETIRYGDQDQVDATHSFLDTFATNYKNAALDIFDEGLRQFGREVQQTDPLEQSVFHNVAGLVYAASQLVDRSTPQEFGSAIDEAAKARQAARQAENLSVMNQGSMASEVAASAGQSLAMMTGAIAGSGGRVPNMLMNMYYMSAAQAENQAIDAGMSQTKAGLYGQIQGIIEAATEAWPGSKLLEGGLLSPVKKKLGEFLLRELPSEQVATFLQDLNTKLMGVQPDMSWKDFLHDQLLTLVTTPLTAGAQIGAVNAASATGNKAVDVFNTYKANVAEAQKGKVLTAAEQARQAQIEDFVQSTLQAGQSAPPLTAAYHATTDTNTTFDKNYITGQSTGDVWGLQLSSDANIAMRNALLKRGIKQQPGPVPRVLPVTIPETMSFLQADTELKNQPPEIKAALERMKINTESPMTGLEFYKRGAANAGGGITGAKLYSEYLSKLGIKGMTFERTLGTEAGPVKVQNYSVFDTSNSAVAQAGAGNVEMNASQAKLAGVRETVKQLMKKPPEVAWLEKMDSLTEALLVPDASIREAKQSVDLREYMDRLKGDVVKWNWFVKYTAGLETIAKLNAGVPGVTNYLDAVHKWWALRSSWIDKADQVVKDWQGIIKDPAVSAQLDKFLFEADRQSEMLKRELNPTEMQKIIDDNKLTLLKDQHKDLARRIWDTYNQSFTAVEDQVIQNILRTVEDEFAANAKIAEVRKTFADLRNRNYLPRTNFGQFTIEAKANEDMTFRGKEFAKGDTVWYSTHRTSKERDKAWENVDKELGSQTKITRDVLTDSQRAWQGVPDNFLNSLIENLQLDESQIAELQLIEQNMSKESAAMRRIQKTRTQAEGYSDDSIRSFGDYFGRFANHIARLTHDHELLGALDTVRSSTQSDMTKRTQLAAGLRQHRDYLNNPGNELAAWRSVGFLWYLGAVPKSALINFTQIPIVTLPYLSQRFENNSATAALSKAIKDYSAYWKGQYRFTPGEQMMRRQLEGLVLNESQATELGAVAEGSQLERVIFNKTGGFQSRTARGIRKAADKLTWMFQKSEIANRNITALAAYNLALKKYGKDAHAQAVNEALKAVRETQFEYARYNRPRMMQRKKSALFLFMQYPSSMLWFIGTDPAKWRVLAMMFAFAGALGLPFAEDILDVLDAALTKIQKLGGYKDPKVQMRRDMREYFTSLFEDAPPEMAKMMDGLNITPEQAADIIMHGASRSVAGTDVSGSTSMGNILPFTDILAKQMSSDQAATQALRGVGGALGSIPLGIAQAVMSDSPDAWKTWEKALPSEARNISRAARWATRGKEEDSTGKTIAYFDPLQDWPLLLRQMAGFPPAELNKRNERLSETRDVIEFYRAYQSSVMNQIYDTVRHDEPGKMAKVSKLISEYNAIVPYPEMSLSGPAVIQSIKQRMVDSAYNEQGAIQERKYQRLYMERTDALGEPLKFSDKTSGP